MTSKTKRRIPERQFLDEVYVLQKGVDVPEEFWDRLQEYTETVEWVNWVKAKWGLGIPLLMQKGDDPKTAEYYTYAPDKQGVPMDWHFYSGQIEITPEDIQNEKNAEKRRLLMTEYGIAKYLTDQKFIQEDAYGYLFDATIEGESQRFVRVVNGTPEEPDAAKYYAERDMLAPNGCRYYFIAVPNTVTTAKEAVAWTWQVPAEVLPEGGWDFES